MHRASMAACHKRPGLWSSGLPCSRWGWTFNNSFIDKTIVMCFFGVVNEVFDRFRGAAQAGDNKLLVVLVLEGHHRPGKTMSSLRLWRWSSEERFAFRVMSKLSVLRLLEHFQHILRSTVHILDL